MCIKWCNLCCNINKLNQIIHRVMINKNSSYAIEQFLLSHFLHILEFVLFQLELSFLNSHGQMYLRFFLYLLLQSLKVIQIFIGSLNLLKVSHYLYQQRLYVQISVYPQVDWQSLMLYIATFIIRFICELNKNNKNQVNCLIVDDTMIERCRGKKVELLSRQYNHVIGKTVKGFYQSGFRLD